MVSIFLVLQAGAAFAQTPDEVAKPPVVPQQDQQQIPQGQQERSGSDRRWTEGRSHGDAFENDYYRNRRGDREDFGYRGQGRSSGYGYRDERRSDFGDRDGRYGGERFNRESNERNRFGENRYYREDRGGYDGRERFRGRGDHRDDRRPRVRICVEDDEGNMFCRVQRDSEGWRRGL